MNLGYRRLFFWSLLAVVLCWVSAVSAEEEPAEGISCALCHEDVASAFERTAHATAPGWDRETGCESCHGEITQHIDSDLNIVGVVRMQELSPGESSRVCLDCHRRMERHFAGQRNIHRLGDVGCIGCHNPHSTANQLLRKQGADLCAECHQALVAQFDLPRSHPLPELGEACYSCHDPHATNGLRAAKGWGNEPCVSCHFEKAGPFLYNHDIYVVDGCPACHEVHGTPTRHLLKHELQANLCYQCHNASVTPPWHSAPRFLNEKCTACHTAIHGSNTNPFFLEE